MSVPNALYRRQLRPRLLDESNILESASTSLRNRREAAASVLLLSGGEKSSDRFGVADRDFPLPVESGLRSG